MTALKVFSKKEKGKIEAKPESKEKAAPKTASRVLGQIIRPHITEKATNLAAKNQYVFVVQPRAHKGGVARSIEKMYGVNVEQVRMVNVHAKEMLLGRTKGIKKGYKKAIVKVKEGQKIDILPT